MMPSLRNQVFRAASVPNCPIAQLPNCRLAESPALPVSLVQNAQTGQREPGVKVVNQAGSCQ
jgi:hypothetical protein